MIIYLAIVFIILTVSLFIGTAIIQQLIVNRLREMNNGIEHPLVSKDGISGNVYNDDFKDFLGDIEGEDDPKLRLLKILSKIFFRMALFSSIVSFYIIIKISIKK